MFDKPLNRLLRNQPHLKEKLKPFSGKTVRFNVSVFTFNFGINTEGEFTVSSAEPDAQITFDPSLIPHLVSRSAIAPSEIKIVGDTELAATMSAVLRNLEWDIEEDLSKIFGDVVAHRLTGLGTELMNWGKQVHESVSRSFAEYWVEENPMLARKTDVAEFIKEVDALREATERLDKKILLLGKKTK